MLLPRLTVRSLTRRRSKVGDAIAIEHSGWWGPEWARQFDANGDDPLRYVLGQVNILKGLSLAVVGMCVGEEVEASLVRPRRRLQLRLRLRHTTTTTNALSLLL